MCLIFENEEHFFSRGKKIFSLLKPSKTVRSIKRIERVFQSISPKMPRLGLVIKIEKTAAITETVSIGSFFKRFLKFNLKTLPFFSDFV